MSYRNNRFFGDEFISSAIRCLVHHGLDQVDIACDQLDCMEATDLIGYRGGKDISVAFRVRDYDKFYSRYGDDFTIRFRKPSGADTEYHKIMQGYADWFLYVFGSAGTQNIIKYGLVSVDGIRMRLRQIGYDSTKKREQLVPGSGDYMICMRWDELPASCFIGSNIVRAGNMVSEENVDWLDRYIAAS